MVVTDTSFISTTTIDPEAAQGLREQLGGNLLTPEDRGYDEARSIWNGMIDKRPALIAQPSGVADVIQIVRFAREQQLKVSIRGGGHNVAGHAVSQDGLMIDLSNMNSVRVDPFAQRAYVEGGALLSDVDRETGAFGLALPAGTVSTTGVAGLTLGGGIGWLVGKHGMTIDNLLSVNLVTAEGELLHVSKDDNPDLFWALRGGGGNFGVVTAFEFKLHPISPVLAGMIAWPIEKAREVMEFYRDFTATNPEIMTTYCVQMTHPENGLPIVAIALCYPGDVEEGQQVIEPIRNFSSPIVEMVDVMPFQVWQQANDVLFPAGRRYYWKSNLLVDIRDEVLDAVTAYGLTRPAPTSSIIFEHYRGPMNRVPATETAFPHRDTQYQMLILGAWDDPAVDETGIQWARGLYAATRQYATSNMFLNFSTPEPGDQTRRVQAGLGPNMERLVAVKRRYDPTNFFAENNNISPE